MAITDRTGPDDSLLELYMERTEWDRLPALGTLVCAIGNDGWRYIGPVTAIDPSTRSYTIMPIASNKRLDNIKSWNEVQDARTR
jgi:hypothetical protein